MKLNIPWIVAGMVGYGILSHYKIGEHPSIVGTSASGGTTAITGGSSTSQAQITNQLSQLRYQYNQYTNSNPGTSWTNNSYLAGIHANMMNLRQLAVNYGYGYWLNTQGTLGYNQVVIGGATY